MTKITRETISLADILATPETLDPITYRYYKCLENRQIIINDEISNNIIEMAVLPLMEMDNDGSGKPIEIILNSCGGDVYSGFSLVAAIENSTSPIIIRIMGIAASMASLIAMSYYNKENVKTVCSPYSVALIHSGSQYLSGSTHAVKDTFKFSERYEERIKNYILTHSLIDEEMYDKIERQEFWMDSDDLVKYGIVQEVLA